MGGKNYPKKGKAASGAAQQPSTSSSIDGRPQPRSGASSSEQPPEIRPQLQQQGQQNPTAQTQGCSKGQQQQQQQQQQSKIQGPVGVRELPADKGNKTSDQGGNDRKLFVEYKGPGKRGKILPEIEANYLKLNLSKIVENAYHYDVKIEPDRPKKLLAGVFWEFVRVHFPSDFVAFDGTKNAYASKPLEICKLNLEQPVTFIHPQTGKELKFQVSIGAAKNNKIAIKNALKMYTNTRQSQDPKSAMQALEVILKSAFHQPRLRNGAQGGRSFFLPPPDGRGKYLGDFYELWLGLFQSLVLGEMPLLNVDVNHKAFPKAYKSLIDLLKDYETDENIRLERMQRNRQQVFKIDLNKELDANIKDMLKRHLSGLDICYTIPGTENKSIYKFMGFGRKPEEIPVYFSDGRKINVLKFFQNSKRTVQYPQLPCVQLPNIKIGNEIKERFVPMEFCSIPSKQVINKKCTENQTRNLIRVAATNTNDRQTKIMNLINQIGHNQSPTIKGFGLSLDEKFVKVQARLLDAPKIEYAKGTVQPQKGAWRGENMEFLIPMGTNTCKITWGILNTNSRTSENINEFAKMVVKISRSNGLQLADQPSYRNNVNDRHLDKIGKELERIGKQKEIDILFCIIPDSGPTYAKIKQMSELQYGVLTQCIKSVTIYKKRNDPSTISNILLKVNAKLNGTNHKLHSTPILYEKKCMVVGADVTHPSRDQTTIPSIVGSVASHDKYAFCYNTELRYQDPRLEMIQDFRNIMKGHLEAFKAKIGSLPDEILYFRDGVSESQFDQVMEFERNGMLQACHEMSPGYEKWVKMTIIIAQKRHHTRLFPGDTGVGRGDRNNNVPAGTIVDTVITRPNENHFFLVSHQSIQGVAKPTKYCILLDEGDHSIDDLQGLTYNLCHMFSRCNRAVSYPTPTYNAHLLAARGRIHIDGEDLNMDDLQNELKKRTVKDNISKVHPMFYV